VRGSTAPSALCARRAQRSTGREPPGPDLHQLSGLTRRGAAAAGASGPDAPAEPSSAGDTMPAVEMSEAEIQAECDSALADARVAPERVRFYLLAELQTEGGHIGAAWFRPYMEIAPNDPGFPDDDAQRDKANSDDNRALHPISVPAAPSDRATFAGLVRHELEHARQYEAGAGIGDLHDFIEYSVLPEVARGLDGCAGALINSIPDEIDCNAAASVYVTSRFSAAEVQAIRDGPRRYLMCSLIPPGSPNTLPARMVAFAFVYREAVERYAERRNFSAAAILGAVHGKAPALWTRLEQGLV
jgi:hypothetical protein